MASELKAEKTDQPKEASPWDAALDKLTEWDPAWAATPITGWKCFVKLRKVQW